MLKIQFRDNRKPAMWLVDSTLKIGSDPSCDIVIKESSVAPVHVELIVNQESILLRNVSTNRSVFINEIPVVKEHQLGAWDLIKIGSSELEIIDPLSDRSPAPVKQPAQATVIRPAVSPWMLKAESSPLTGQYFSLANGNVIGREEKSDIKLPFTYISRKHAKISLKNEKLYVEDMGSSNGTYVNGERVKSCELRNGDTLKLDQFVFQVIGPEVDTAVDVKPRTIVKDHTPKKNKPVEPRPKDMPAKNKVFLHGLSDHINGQVYEISMADNHISRLLGHHLSTSESSVSARHVYLNETENGWEIKNDGASDGLLVNGKMQSRAVLQEADEIIVGGTLLKFQCVGNEPLNYAKPVKSAFGTKVWIAVVLLVALGLGGLYFSRFLA